MRPTFQIFADQLDVTAKIQDRLLRLTVTDEAGIKSDTAEISLDDRDAALEVPRRGAKLEVWLGYIESGIYLMGTYVVDEIELSGPPRTMLIRAKAADMLQSLKSPKTRPWDKVTLGSIVETIASEHGYQPGVDSSLAGIYFEHVDQTEESDMHFLTRLAKQYDAVAKPANGFMVLAPKGSSKSASGQDLPAVSLGLSDLTSWNVTLADRGKYKTVKVYYHDWKTGKRTEIKIGTEDPAYVLRHTYPDAEQAKAAGSAKLEGFFRGEAKASFCFPGNPLVAAEILLTVTGVRDGVDGDWIVRSVTHEFSNSGYNSRVEAEAPKEPEASAQSSAAKPAGTKSSAGDIDIWL